MTSAALAKVDKQEILKVLECACSGVFSQSRCEPRLDEDIEQALLVGTASSAWAVAQR
jgi:hypothetical protein